MASNAVSGENQPMAASALSTILHTRWGDSLPEDARVPTSGPEIKGSRSTLGTLGNPLIVYDTNLAKIGRLYRVVTSDGNYVGALLVRDTSPFEEFLEEGPPGSLLRHQEWPGGKLIEMGDGLRTRPGSGYNVADAILVFQNGVVYPAIRKRKNTVPCLFFATGLTNNMGSFLSGRSENQAAQSLSIKIMQN